jgi:hypothetical protein
MKIGNSQSNNGNSSEQTVHYQCGADKVSFGTTGA